MSKLEFYEVKGKTREAILKLDKAKAAALQEGHTLGKKMGARATAAVLTFTPSLAFAFDEPPDTSLWKPTKHPQGYWVPKKTKAARALSDSVAVIEEKLPGSFALAELLGGDLAPRKSASFFFPQYRLFSEGPRKRVIVRLDMDACQKNFKVPDGKRITDVQYEEMVANAKRRFERKS